MGVNEVGSLILTERPKLKLAVNPGLETNRIPCGDDCLNR